MFTGETVAAGVADKAVGMWLFDDGGGDTAKDSSGNGNDGTLVSGPEWVDGKFGGALKFDGTATLVDCGTGDSLNLAGSTNFSLAAWIKPASAQSDKVIVWKGLGCSTWSQYFLGVGCHESAGGASGPKLAFHFRTGNNSSKLEVADKEDLPVGNWLHVAGTYDGSQLKLYRDGELVSTQDAEGEPWASTEKTYIGGDPGCGVRGIFDGLIDEVMVFDVTLTDSEVKELATAGATGAAVEPAGKLSTTWAKIKYQN